MKPKISIVSISQRKIVGIERLHDLTRAYMQNNTYQCLRDVIT